MNKRQFLLFLALLFSFVGCNRTPDSARTNGVDNASADADAEVMGTPTPRPPNREPVGTTILADGQIVAVNPPLSLSFATSGPLLAIHVNAGDQVAAGSLIATLDDSALRQAVADGELQVEQAELSLAQAQLSLDELNEWQPDEMAVMLAEANLAAAEAGYESALSQYEVSGNSLTQARIGVTQAERAVADAQEAYDTAWDPGRNWELQVPGRKERLENERDSAERALQQAQESLEIARANYSLALAGLNDDTVVNAEAAVASARQALHQALTGPSEAEIAATTLQVTQAELSLKQAELNLDLATQRLEDARLYAPWDGLVLSVDAAVGAIVGSGVPVITLWDTSEVEFHTSNLSERDLAYVEPGQSVQIILKSYTGQPLTGRVTRIVPRASGQVGDAATFTVVIAMEETDLRLMSGMTGRAEIKRQIEE